jgi:hypothetical protein
VYAPEFNLFEFKLAGKTNRRVRGFFPEMDPGVYSAAIDGLGRELERQRIEYLAISSVEHGLTVFRNMLRRRETLLHFAEPGMRLGDPLNLLKELFAEYVERRFAQLPEFQEKVMQDRLNHWLKEWGIRKQYRANQPVGDLNFRISLPFVRKDGNTVIAAIKPMDLKRPDTTKIFDHGGLWIQRFRRLEAFRQLPERMIIPVAMPVEPRHITAAAQVLNELRQMPVRVVPFEDQDRIKELALF